MPGETVFFALTIDVEGGAYSGFQFQMQFPAEGFTTAGTTITSDWDGGSLGVGDLVAGEANASASSMSDTAIPDGERVIGTVKFTVADGLALGDYPVTISGFNFLDGTNYTPVADVTFYVHVVSLHSVVLDETSTTAPVASDGAVNVRVLRTIKANEWSTICLPFAMTEAQVKTAFGDDVQLGDFNDYDYDEGADAMSVVFVNATAIEANHPYIIKVADNVTSFAVEGVTIDPQEAVIDFDTDRRHRYPRRFVGTYVANTELDWGTLFLNGNRFWYSVGNTKMKAFRAYFSFYDVLASFDDTYASRIAMTFGHENTGIKDIEHSPLTIDHSVYDLQGRKIENGRLKIENSERSQSSMFNVQSSIMKKGLYIVNGKKVIK
jgi:hypothetical protein